MNHLPFPGTCGLSCYITDMPQNWKPLQKIPKATLNVSHSQLQCRDSANQLG